MSQNFLGPHFMNFRNKLERFVPGKSFQPSLIRIRLGWKGLPGTNALGYYKNSKITLVKSCITLASGANVTKLFMPIIYGFCIKLECLSLVSLCSLVYCLWARPGPNPRVEHLKGAQFGKAQTLLKNIRL